uniref:U17-Hexatoxin-Hc1ah_1 n=2 Tax=Hadronyche cerberea TaxID=1107879 RepID=A0A4Q8KBV1_HADCE
MKLLYFFVVITVLVAVAVALPAKTAEEIAAEENQLVEDLVQYTGTRLTQKRATSCSKKLGESCAYHCECCGPTVSCSTVYVGGKETNFCSDKTSNNAALNTIGKGMNAISNGFSAFQCWGLTRKIKS